MHCTLLSSVDSIQPGIEKSILKTELKVSTSKGTPQNCVALDGQKILKKKTCIYRERK